MDTDEARITLRIPGDLAQLLREAAAKDHRSLNATILVLLEHGLGRRP